MIAKKINRIIYVVLMMAAIGCAVGCRSHKNVADNQARQHPGGSVPEETATAKPKLDTILNASYQRYSANFSCSVEGITLNGQIRIVHDSCIWISLNKLIEVGRIMITPTRVSGYAKLLGKYYDGSYEEVRRRWGIDIDYATIEAMIVGNCPPNCTRSKEPEKKGDEVKMWYTQKGKIQRKVAMTKDYATKTLKATEISTAKPLAQVSCQYRERAVVESQMLPTTVDVKVSLGSKSKKTQLSMSRISLNHKQNVPFSIPSRLEKL